jgi:hypothetical protein
MAKASRTKATTEPKSRKRKADDPQQYERFRDFARQVGADSDPEGAEKKIRKVITNSVRSARR